MTEINWWRRRDHQKCGEPSDRVLGTESPNKSSPVLGRKDAYSYFVELLLTQRV